MTTKKVIEMYGEEIEILLTHQKDKDHVLVTTVDETGWVKESEIKIVDADKNRSCNCGSGQPWSSCSANSQYCG